MGDGVGEGGEVGGWGPEDFAFFGKRRRRRTGVLAGRGGETGGLGGRTLER